MIVCVGLCEYGKYVVVCVVKIGSLVCYCVFGFVYVLMSNVVCDFELFVDVAVCV